MNESGIGQVAQTVANTLADERATHTVHFPLTGVLEADLVSGVTAIIRAVENPTMDQNRAIMRVLQMLAAEYEDIVKESDRVRDLQARHIGDWQYAQGSSGSGIPAGTGIGHYTTGGTGPYPGSLMQAVQPMVQQASGLINVAPGISQLSQVCADDAKAKAFKALQDYLRKNPRHDCSNKETA